MSKIFRKPILSSIYTEESKNITFAALLNIYCSRVVRNHSHMTIINTKQIIYQIFKKYAIKCSCKTIELQNQRLMYINL